MYKTLPLLLLVWMLGASTACAGFYVVANSEVPEQSLDQSELKSIYLGKKAAWSDNSSVHPARYLRGDLHEEFVRSVTGKSPRQFRVFWKRAIFTGKVVPFTEFDDEAELVEWVRQTPGAIGYVRTKPQLADLKVLYHSPEA